MQMVLGCDWEVCRLLSQKGTLSVPGFLLASTFITKGHKVFVIPMDSEQWAEKSNNLDDLISMLRMVEWK
jgi:hypothetical protein